MGTGALLEIRDLTVSYETDYGPLRAVDAVSLAIRPGEALGVVGESGSGKSTIAAAVLDLLSPGASVDGGAIVFEDQDLRRLAPAHRRQMLGDRIGTVFQDPFSSLNPSLRVGLQIAEPLVQHRGTAPRQALDRARELLSEMGIANSREVAQAYPHQLSGGMKQRALIAAALACEPALVILDEPTTALDVTIEAQILDLLHDLRERRNLSLLFISHNLAVVRRLCDNVCVLYAGRVMEHGRADAVFETPSHPYTKGLFASLPRIATSERAHRLAPIPGNLPSLVSLPAGCAFHPRCPFSEDRCVGEAQSLEEWGEGRATRCWKAPDLMDQGWPVSEHPPARAKVPGGSAPLVEIFGLSKSFRLGGFWDSFRLREQGEAGFPIVHEPRILTAVDRVTLDIAPGEVLGLVGESGCGKSTLGRCVIRLIDPSAGDISFEGAAITSSSRDELVPFRRAAQIIFQNPDSSLNPRMTVAEIVGRPLRRFRIVEGHALAKRVEALLDMVRLAPSYAERYPHQLSGGEKQRVGIARALASEPRFIVCDEAVSALDVSVQAAVINLLADLRDELNLALLFISHDLSVVAHLADRIAVMYQGTICELGPTEEILHPPYHPYTQALLSSIPHLALEGAVTERIRLPGEVTAGFGDKNHCPFHRRCPVKLGAICETVEPPVLEAAAGHRILCHHPLERLSALRPILPGSHTRAQPPETQEL